MVKLASLKRTACLTVTGHIDLEKDTIAIPLSFDTAGGGSPLGLDITVNVGKKVNLYSAWVVRYYDGTRFRLYWRHYGITEY